MARCWRSSRAGFDGGYRRFSRCSGMTTGSGALVVGGAGGGCRGCAREGHREEGRPVAPGDRVGVAAHVPGVARQRDDEAAVGRQPRDGERAVRVQDGIVVGHHLLHRRPRPPRIRGDVDGDLLTPEAVLLRDGHPAPVDEAGLHRVLGPVPGVDGLGLGRVLRPAGARPVLRSLVEAAAGHAGEPHVGGRVRPVPEAALEGQVLLVGVAEQVAEAVVGGDGVAVEGRRLRTRGRRAGGGDEAEAGQVVGVVGGQPGLDRVPRQPVPGGRLGAVVDHLGPEHPQHAPVQLAPEWPPPAGEDDLAGTGLEGRRLGRGAAVEQGEAGAGLQQGGVVGEADAVEAGGQARVVDERVLEQPQPPAGSERVDVLVVPAQHRTDALAEERGEVGGAGGGCAPDVGGDVAGGGDPGGRGPRRWRRRRRWWRGTAHQRHERDGGHRGGRGASSGCPRR